MSDCQYESNDQIYKVVNFVTFICYTIEALVVLALVVFLVKKRGNKVAIFITVFFFAAYSLKGLSLSGFVEIKNIKTVRKFLDLPS